MHWHIKRVILSLLIGVLSWISFHLAIPLAKTSFHGIDVCEKGSTHLYSTQSSDDLARVYLQAIQSAQKSITLAIYALSDFRVIRALQEKAQEGVKVHILYDPKASHGIREKIPLASFSAYEGRGLMHQKILIVDAKKIWLGSANMTASSLDLHHNLAFMLDNPSLAGALLKKIEKKKSQTPAPIIGEIGDQTIEIWILPDGGAGIKRVKQLLLAAKKTIRIAMYTWTRIDLAKELVHLSLKGVKVEVVLDNYSTKGAGSKVFNLLTEGKIPTWVSDQRRLMHHKFALIDGDCLIFGSANWTMRAFQENDDFFAVLYPLSALQKAKMDRIWDATHL